MREMLQFYHICCSCSIMIVLKIYNIVKKKDLNINNKQFFCYVNTNNNYNHNKHYNNNINSYKKSNNKIIIFFYVYYNIYYYYYYFIFYAELIPIVLDEINIIIGK